MKGPFHLILCANSKASSRQVKFLPSAETPALEWVVYAHGRTASIVKKMDDAWRGIAYYANNKGTLIKLRYDH